MVEPGHAFYTAFLRLSRLFISLSGEEGDMRPELNYMHYIKSKGLFCQQDKGAVRMGKRCRRQLARCILCYNTP